MNNQNYTVVHSPDPWLLARLSTDLMMEGIRDDREWNEWLLTGKDDFDTCLWIELNFNVGFSYHSHKCIDNPLRLTLTASNYLTTLKTIIERHGK